MGLSVSKIALVAAFLSSAPIVSANAAELMYEMDDGGVYYTQPVYQEMTFDTEGTESTEIATVNGSGYYVTNIVGSVNGVTQAIPSIMRANVSTDEAAAAAKQLLTSNPEVQGLIAQLSSLPNGNAALVALAKNPGTGADILSRFNGDNLSAMITGLAQTPAVAFEGMTLAGLENMNAMLQTFDSAELANYLETHQLSGVTDNQFWSLYHENLDDGEESFEPDELSTLFDEGDGEIDGAGDDEDYGLLTEEDGEDGGEDGGEEVASGGIDNTDEEAYDEYGNEEGGTGGSGGGTGSGGSGSGSGGGSSQGWKII